MNVDHDHRLVFLAVPRTGSRITFRTLQQIGMTGGAPNGGMTHQMRTPGGCEDYLHVATVRLPFTRWVSCWTWCKTWPVNPGSHYEEFARFLRDNPNDFAGFVRRAVAKRYIRTTSSYLTQVAYAKRWALLRYESLNDDLGRVLDQIGASALTVPLKHGRATLRWRTYYDETTTRLVVEHSKEDFERYGYSTNIDDH